MLPAQVQQQLAQLKASPAYKFLEEHAGLPDNLKNIAPPVPRNRFSVWFFYTLLPFLGFGLRVWTEKFEQDGKDYYLIHMHMPFRHNHLITRPFGAWTIGMALHALIRHGALTSKVGEIVIGSDEDVIGTVGIPMWAVPQLIHELATIVGEHKERVQFLDGEMKRLAALPAPEAEQDNIEEEEEGAAEQRVLH